ncbi:MAG: prepilin-type N-terminal cleavage/methylation domain-containing protein [Pirellulales bacterium]|nr:prepilin-type N-terminal cleavage/methylation domain-containing protein [Pirellulales bacterium]
MHPLPPRGSAPSVVKKSVSASPRLRGEKSVSASLRLRGEKTVSPAPCLHGGKTPRRGLTLVELLVVVTIMMILVGFALPRLRPASDQRRIREAARMVNVFLNRARARAIETGRPCGVLFQPIDNPVNDSTAASATLYQVEVPQPYMGGSTDSRVTRSGLRLTATVPSDFMIPDFIQQGDLIQLNHQGPWYEIASVSGGTLFLKNDPPKTSRIPPYPRPVPFSILRRPSATIAAPLRLPEGTVVDLSASGLNDLNLNPMTQKTTDPTICAFSDSLSGSGQDPVTILFSPNGSVERCYYHDTNESPSGPMYLLIGRESQVGVGTPTSEDVSDEKKPNWQLPDSLWIALLPQSGLVSVAESAVPTDWYEAQTKPKKPEREVGIDEARSFAKQSQSMGGR